MSATHAVRRLWVRPSSDLPPTEQQTLDLEEGAGVAGDHTHGKKRQVTILFEDDWIAAARELGDAPVDPVGRRANVLVSGSGAQSFLGQRIDLGPVSIEVAGIVHPCALMNEAAPGMEAALDKDGRAGIWGRVLNSGTVRIGDVLSSAGVAAGD